MSVAAPTTGQDELSSVDLNELDVPAESSLEEQRPRSMKHGDSFAVFDNNGDIHSGPGRPEGLYHGDTRHLSHLRLWLDGHRPMLLRSSLRDDNAALICDLTNPDLHEKTGRIRLKHNRIHLRRVRVLWNATTTERITIRNFDSTPVTVRIMLEFAADFADIFEVRGVVRPKRGTLAPPKVWENGVRLAYTGLDHRLRETFIRFEPAPQEINESRAQFIVSLAPGETRVLFFEVSCDPLSISNSPRRAFFQSFMSARRSLRTQLARAASISSSNDLLNEAVRRSVADLYMLCTNTKHGIYPYAGIPWFSTVFGRDALITALQTLWFDPSIALGVLRYLAANQATRVDKTSDAEPGKILHEVRHSEMAELGEVPFRCYYGSVDSTPLFVLLAGAYLERTDDIDSIRALMPNIDNALKWIETHGDLDGDGFVEYHRQTDAGLSNQGWKDSYDSISHEDGALAQSPIALAEVQAYVYAAWKAAAAIVRRLGHMDRARTLEIRADVFRRRFDKQFFDAELGTYVLALDANKNPCRVRSSNAGHVLYCGLAYPERAAIVTQTLMSSFTGFGVRTLSTLDHRYNPMSYHNGSVWPHDNALIAAGLARYGFRNEATQIFTGLFDAANYMDLRRLPELFCGFPRQRGSGPVFYPVACSPQAWATGAFLMLLQASLGLSFAPAEKRIIFERPILPSFVDEIVLRNLRVGEENADVAIRKSHTGVMLEVLRRSPNCSVVSMA
jgi:glycogen debranching enzyme